MRVRTLGVTFLLALWSGATHAGPKTAPTTKANPIQSSTASAAQSLLPQLDVEITKQVTSIPRLEVADKVALAASLGHEIAAQDILSATRLSIRRPWSSASTHLSFMGIARFDPNGNTVTMGMGLSGLSPDQLIGLLWGPRGPEIHEVNTLQVHFQAAAGRHYLVACTTSSPDVMTGGAKVGDEALAGSVVVRDGHATFFVAAASERRDVRVLLSARDAWTTGGCEITPLRD